MYLQYTVHFIKHLLKTRIGTIKSTTIVLVMRTCVLSLENCFHCDRRIIFKPFIRCTFYFAAKLVILHKNIYAVLLHPFKMGASFFAIRKTGYVAALSKTVINLQMFRSYTGQLLFAALHYAASRKLRETALWARGRTDTVT